jgi:hypothetical protein
MHGYLTDDNDNRGFHFLAGRHGEGFLATMDVSRWRSSAWRIWQSP